MNIISWSRNFKHLKGQHNQKRHGWRYSAGVPLSKLRRQRDTADEGYDAAGEWTQYKKRVIARHGLDPKNKLTFNVNNVKAANSEPYKDVTEYELTSTPKFAKWEKSITPDEKNAISYYTGAGYMDLNHKLRYGGDLDTYEQHCLDNMTPVLKRFQLPDNTMLYRGAGSRVSKADQVMPGTMQEAIRDHTFKVGSVLKDNAFTSASIDTNGAKGFEKDIMFNIKAPKGTKGAYVGISGGLSGEREFIFPPGTKFMITKIREKYGGQSVNEPTYDNYSDKPKFGNRYIIDIMIVE